MHKENMETEPTDLPQVFPIQVIPIGVKESRWPECQSEMSAISFITEVNTKKKIPKYPDRCEETVSDPPHSPQIPDEIAYIPFDNAAWDRPESPDFVD